MAGKKFDKLFDFFAQKKIISLLIFFLIIILSLVRISRTSFVNDVAVMLPDSFEINRAFDYINNCQMSDTIAFSISLKDPSQNNLISLSDTFSKNLEKIDRISKVVSGVENFDPLKIKEDLAKLLPRLLSKEEYALFKDIDNKEVIKTNVKLMFIMLTTPGSSFLQSSMSHDPFGWSNHIMGKLKVLSKTMGFNVELQNNHFMDRTFKHTLVIANTDIPVTDADGSQILLDKVRQAIAKSKNLNIEFVCGHKHTLSNQNTIKKDIFITTIIVTLSFIVLMLFIFKSIDALSIFILPFFSIIIAVFISTCIFHSLSLFMIGFAAVIAGISVDYGIHLFTAFKTGGYERFKKTIKPVIIASLSTMGVFISFFFSSVHGYKELAFFSILSIVLCIGLSIFLLPHFWSKKNSLKQMNIPFELSAAKSKLAIFLWGLIFILSIFTIADSNLEKATDISSFDGSDETVFETEEKFYNIWGGRKSPGVIVTRGKTIEEAWKEYEFITDRLKTKIKGFNSLATILPSIEQQKKNLKDWHSFWTDSQIANLKNDFSKALKLYGFKEESFTDFFKLLKSDNMEITKQIPDSFDIFKPHFVKKRDTYTLISYFDDTKTNNNTIDNVLEKTSNSYVVSRTELSSIIGSQLYLDIKKISLLASLWVVALIIFFLKKPVMIFLSLLPVFTSISFVFLVFKIASIEISAIVLIALIIILGISLDYGVFISTADSEKEKKSVLVAATFSMLTTIMGAGALLFASHPVMFSIGLTLVSGVTAAYLSAVFLIPAFKKVLT